MKKHLVLTAALGLAIIAAAPARAYMPVVSDSRIKTFVYSENDVFALQTHYGYQTNIEFGERESIQTISIGDRIGWQIVPAGRRLFIRPMETSIRTNMTVITDRRAYQFDLHSGEGADLPETQELAYVVRFYYPGDEKPALRPASVTSAAMAAATQSMAAPQPSAPLNFQYTFTGPDGLAPLQIYDDGRMTFFKLAEPPGAPAPAIFAVTADKAEHPVQAERRDGFFVAPLLARRFVVKYGVDLIHVYNESR